MRLSPYSRVVAAASLLAAVPAGAFGPAVLQSVWRARPILVDGSDRDWTSQAGDDAGAVTAAFANDRRDLYILLRPKNADVRARLAGGDLVLWLDVSNAGAKRLGLRLRAPGSGQTQADRSPDLVGTSAPAAAQALPRTDPCAARMGASDTGVFEARVPLALLGTPAPSRLAVGIESAEPVDAPSGEESAGAGVSGWSGRGNWQGGSNAAARGSEDSGGLGGGRFAGRPSGGGRGASLAITDTGSALTWLRVDLAPPAQKH